MLQTEMNKLFETNVRNANPLGTLDADIILTSVPYLQYEHIELDPNFRVYLESTLAANSFLRTGLQKTPYHKTFEVNVGSQSHVTDFMGANKQFSFISVSLGYDKPDQHRNLYDSYNVELASKSIKTILLENTNNSYSSFNNVKLDLNEDDNQYQLNLQFVAWYCKGSSMVPLCDYAKNKTFKELPN